MLTDCQALANEPPEDPTHRQNHWQGHSDENGRLVGVEGIVAGNVCLRMDVHPNGLLVPTSFTGPSNQARMSQAVRPALGKTGQKNSLGRKG